MKTSKLKRVLAIFAVIVLALTTVCVVANASSNKERVSDITMYAEDHTHIYGNWEIIEAATCQKDGLKKRVCTVPGCDAYYTKTIASTADAHVYGAWTTVTEATCTTVGEEKATCTQCGHVETQMIPMDEHTIDEMFDANGNFNSDVWTVTKAPVHGKGLVAQEGYAIAECAICGTTVTESFHYPNNWHVEDPTEPISVIRDTTCSLAGVGMRHCTICGDTLTVTIPIDPDAHSFTGKPLVETAATCQDEGAGVNQCIYCNEIVEVTIDKDPNTHVDAKGNILEWVTTKEPYVHIDGKKEVDCYYCGHQEETIVADHNLTDDDYTIRANPTCVEPGLKIATCNNCHRTIRKEIPVNDSHSWDNGEVYRQATCSEEGITVKHCKRHYGHVIYEVTPTTEHNFVDDWKVTVEVTCTTPGTESNDCLTCKQKIYREIPIDQDAHSFMFDEWKIISESTCEKAGEEENYCTNCQKWIKREIPKHTGTLRKISTTAANCKNAGVTVYQCSKCSAIVNETIPVDENAHEYIGTPAVVTPATCQEKGVGLTVCTYCKKECYVELEIDETNHVDKNGKAVEWTIVKPASGCENGSKVLNCPSCGKNETKVIYSTHGMTMSAFNINVYPKCDTEGQYKSKSRCSKCNQFVYIPIETGHKGTLMSTVRKADCTNDGLALYKCARGDHFFYEIIPATGHTVASEYKVTKVPTCTEKGEKQLYCSVCGEDIQPPTELPESHMLSSWIIDEGNRATCNSRGKRYRICLNDNCDYREETYYNVSHQYGDWKFYSGYNCATGGTLYRQCKNCNRILGTKTVGKNIHGSVSEVTIENCPQHCKFTTNICNICGEVVKKSGDYWVTPDASEVASCTHYILNETTQETEKVVVKYLIDDMKNHSSVIIDGQKGYAATCTEDGKTNGTLCLICGYVTPQQVIKATGHEFQYNENGNKVCIKCGVYKVNNKDNPDIGNTCKCFCHDKGTIAKILFKFCNFIWKFLGVYETCECGTVHWTK